MLSSRSAIVFILLSTLLLSMLLMVGPAPSLVAQSATEGARPLRISIPDALVHATVEHRTITSDGQLQPPSSPWTVGWYLETGHLGAGNAVMVGTKDWWEVGPSVFWFLDDLLPGDPIEVQGDDGALYRYAVTSVTTYERTDPAAIQAIFAESAGHVLTVFSDTGAWDDSIQYYPNVVVVKAELTAAPEPTTPVTPVALDKPEGCPLPAGNLGMAVSADPFTPFPEDIAGAPPVPEDMTSTLGAVIADALPCEISLLEARMLSENQVVALVGPPGFVAVEDLADALCYAWDTTCSAIRSPLRDPARAHVYALLLFTLEDGTWILTRTT